MRWILLSLSLLLVLSTGSLVYVMEVYRHGIREPVYPYWNSLIVNADYGELTSPGMLQQFLLGAEMRREYIEELGFLSPEYNKSEIYVESTNVNRTLMSALSHLQGFYPAGTGPKLPEDYPEEKAVPPFRNVTIPEGLNKSALPKGFRTVPIHSKSRETLNMDRAYVCPIMPYIQKHVNKSHVMTRLRKDFAPQIEKFLDFMNVSDARKEGYPCNQLEIVQEIFDNFQVQKFNNRYYPYIPDDLWFDMLFLYNIGIQVEYFQNEFLKRFFNTLMFRDFREQIDGKLNGSNALKWRTYSAHDSHISQLLSGLNLTSWECIYDKWRKHERDHDPKCAVSFPTYASSIIFEVHRRKDASNSSNSSDDYFIKLKHQGEYKEICGKRSKECSYTEFRERITNYQLDNFDDICHRKKLDKNDGIQFLEIENGLEEVQETSDIAFWMLLGVVEALLIGVLSYKIIYHKRSSDMADSNTISAEYHQIKGI